jgi:hypothetical protein
LLLPRLRPSLLAAFAAAWKKVFFGEAFHYSTLFSPFPADAKLLLNFDAVTDRRTTAGDEF